MRRIVASLMIWMLFCSLALAAPTMYLEGPNQRSEGALPPAVGTQFDTLGFFEVKIYAEDMPSFGGFQTTLEFLDPVLFDVA